MSVLWHNGHFKDDNAPVFTAADRIRLGDGVFDTMLAVDGKSVHPALHFERLLRHAKIMNINGLLSVAALEDHAQELLRKNDYIQGHYAVHTIITRGPGGTGLRTPENPQPQIIMRAAKHSDNFSPVHALIAHTVRRNENSPLSRIKSLNYGDSILALQEAESRGGNEAILLNNRGFVVCAGAGNIFIVQDGKLITPPLSDGVLDGITRKIMIERHKAEEKSLIPEDLQNAESLYITSSLRGACPAVSLDGKEFLPSSLSIDSNFHLS